MFLMPLLISLRQLIELPAQKPYKPTENSYTKLQLIAEQVKRACIQHDVVMTTAFNQYLSVLLQRSDSLLTSVSIAINLIDVHLEFSQSEHQFFLIDNLLFSVLFYSQLSLTVPCCTRVKNTSRRFYILTILPKVSRLRMSHQNSKYFLATECVYSRKASWCICIIKLA